MPFRFMNLSRFCGRFLRREAEGASFRGCGAMSDPLKVFLILTSFTKEVG